MLNPYDSVNQFFSVHGLVRRDRDKWRLTKPVVGEINGLPMSRGILVATNGILCFIDQCHGVYEGHIGWFIPDQNLEIEYEDGTPVAIKEKQPRDLVRGLLEELSL